MLLVMAFYLFDSAIPKNSIPLRAIPIFIQRQISTFAVEGGNAKAKRLFSQSPFLYPIDCAENAFKANFIS